MCKPFVCISLFTLAFTISEARSKNSKDSCQRQTITGISINGWNEKLGEPAQQLPFFGEFHFTVGGILGPNQSLPITSTTPLNSPLATYADPQTYMNNFGISEEEIQAADSAFLDIPYSEYPLPHGHGQVQPGLSYLKSTQLRRNKNPFALTNGAENEGITVRDWLNAKGSLSIICNEQKKEYYYEFEASDLIPGGLYSMHQYFFNNTAGAHTLDGSAFGGAQSYSFTADKDGNIGRAARALNYCPMTWSIENELQLVTLTLNYHIDGILYAGDECHVVQLQNPFIGPGVTITPQLMFTPINCEKMCCACMNEGRCMDEQCQRVVCGKDSFCCNDRWDGICATRASVVCRDQDLPICCDCVSSSKERGCAEDMECERVVCGKDDYCCDKRWDKKCVDRAVGMCKWYSGQKRRGRKRYSDSSDSSDSSSS